MRGNPIPNGPWQHLNKPGVLLMDFAKDRILKNLTVLT